MSGFTTANTQHLIRSQLWSTQLKEAFEDELMGMKYVDFLTDFPDGDVFNIPSIGQAEVLDYGEDQAIRYTAMDTGNFTFSITEYKSSATYITRKQMQDSFYASRLISSFVPKQSRAIMKAMEVDILNVGPAGQTACAKNTINDASHRWIAQGTNQEMTVQDFAAARYALEKADVPMQNLVAIVDPSVGYTLSTLTNIVNVSNNPQWEGIVTSGISTGTTFIRNVYGFDVYVSHNLAKIASETIGTTSVTNGVANLFFSAASDALPIVGAIRQEPTVDSEFNKDLQREEYVTTARYGFKLYRPENMVTVISATNVVPV